jgi:hypothetical protein
MTLYVLRQQATVPAKDANPSFIEKTILNDE